MEEDDSIKVEGNELLQSGTYVSCDKPSLNGKKLSDILGETLLKDGTNGIYDGNATVIYEDAKKFGEVVKIEDSLFRVVGINRRKEGYPITEYDLREVR